MGRMVPSELLHIGDWLFLADVIVMRARDTCSADGIVQAAGDSLLMKLGEAAGRLARAEFKASPGLVWTDAIANRNWLSVSTTRSTAHSRGSLCRAT